MHNYFSAGLFYKLFYIENQFAHSGSRR